MDEWELEDSGCSATLCFTLYCKNKAQWLQIYYVKQISENQLFQKNIVNRHRKNPSSMDIVKTSFD